mgnify:CR=1 FL=1
MAVPVFRCWLCLPAAAPWAIAVFVVLEFILYGFGLWSWMYLYIWFILYGIALLLHQPCQHDLPGLQLHQ